MSYILDALKKKETENSEVVPDIQSQHYHSEFETESSLNWKLIALIIGLIVSAAIIYLAYSLGQRHEFSEESSIAVEQSNDLKENAAAVQSDSSSAVGTESVTNQAQDKAVLQVEAKPIEVKTPVVQKVAIAKPKPEKVAVAKDQVTQDLPPEVINDSTIGATRAEPITEIISDNFEGLPSIRYTSHVYADAPKDRFVMLNGRSIGIGQKLPNGVRIVDILEDDLMISYQGESYKIPSLTDIK